MLGFLLALSIATPATDQHHTGGLLNGYAWIAMSDENRSFYTAGFAEGAIRSQSKSPDFDCDCTLGQMVEGVSAVYADQKNRAIPIVYAWHLFAMKLNGAAKGKVDAETRRYRANAATLKR